MKKTVATTALALLFVLAALAAGVWVMAVRDEVDVSGPVATAAPDPALVARGAYLARAGNCMTCHTTRGGAPYAGGRGINTPFGTVFASNLTPDEKTGIGRWSAAQFWRALHHGKSKDGRLLYPAFPYPNYTEVSRDDSDALHAYLRSLPAVAQPNREHALRWPYSTQAALAVWRALFFRTGTYRADPARSAEWNRGAYLVQGLGHCSACHAPRNAMGATSNMLDLAGGLIPLQNWYAPSLTSAAEAGVQDWSAQHISELLKTGVSPRGGAVTGPMAEVVLRSTQFLSPGDLTAMAVYLKDLPPARGDSAPAPLAPVSAAVAKRGAKLYEQHCAQCHGDTGQGVRGAYPPLAGNRAVSLNVTANLVQMVLNGGYAPATAGNPRPFGMPPYVLVLSDADIAAVLTHVRGNWGNQAAPVSEFEVSRYRGTPSR